MSYALKRKLPTIYKLLKKFEIYIPASTLLWDKKKYKVNLKIISMLSVWKSWPRLKREADIVFNMYEGGDLIDIGAYHGVYSFLLGPKAKLEDNFILCEPDPDAEKTLFENLSILKRLFKKVKFQFISEPIGDGKNVFKNPTDYGHPVYSAERNSINTLEKKEIILQSEKIDDLVKRLNLKPTFVKIDVEGAEYSILKGMPDTLKDFKPLVMLEKHPTLLPNNISINEINNFLKDKGYEVESEIFQDDIAITQVWKNYN